MNPYDIAIQMSLDGERFFGVLKRKVMRPVLRKILVMLQKDQVLQRREFEEMKKEEVPSPLEDAGHLTAVLNPFALRIERLGASKWPGETLSSEELRRRGQKLAKECEDFYRKRAARVRDTGLRQAFLRIAEVHRKHHLGLERLMNAEWEIARSLERKRIRAAFGTSPRAEGPGEEKGKEGDGI